MANDKSWKKIFKDYKINKHDFTKDGAFTLSASQIKKSCQNFKKTAEKEVRILCKQDSRTDRPQVFIEKICFFYQLKTEFIKLLRAKDILIFLTLMIKRKHMIPNWILN